MWGNRLGWILAVLLALGIGLVLTLLIKLERPTAPTALTQDDANLAPIDLPIPPEEAWPVVASDDRDAGDLYRQVAMLWNDQAIADCRQFIRSPAGLPPQAMRILLQSAHFRRMRLFANDLPDVINYSDRQPEMDALDDAGQMACKIGLFLGQAHRIADAMPYFEAAFNLGRNLYNERIIYAEFQHGMGLMASAVGGAKLIEPSDSDLANRLALFDAKRLEYEADHIEPLWRAIDSADVRVIAANAGDVFVLAKQAREPMWRVEATLKLGRFKFDVSVYGDQAAANRAINQLLTDPDPRVAAAATAARDLTIEQYRSLGGQ